MNSIQLFVVAWALTVAGGGLALGQEKKAETTLPAMQELSPGVFQIGKMRLDKNAKSIAFPGKLNMAKDLARITC